MSAPIVIQDAVLREVLARAIAKREAAELRAWKRRRVPSRVRTITTVALYLAGIVWALVALAYTFAAFDL